VADDACHVEDALHPRKRGRERVGSGDIAQHGLDSLSFEQRRGGRASHQRPHLSVSSPELADEISAEVAGRAGDEGEHRGSLQIARVVGSLPVVELGLYTFAERTPDAITGQSVSPAQRLHDLIEEVELADQLGLDVFGVGEHHRPEFVVSAPTVVLAAAAARTTQITLTSAVTVLSSDDPVRVYEQFATLDLLSGGRAEIMAGRGSFIESFPLFGYSLDDYDDLFAEKLDLLLALRESERITWSGVHRPPLDDLGVFPQPEQQIPIWIAVGGTPASVVRAGSLGLPMALAIIGGLPERFVPMADLHRRAASEAGFSQLPLSINSHGFISDTAEQAIDDSFASVASVMDQIGRERGWPPMTREQYVASATLRGANFVGSPQQVIDKILYQHELFGHDRFMLQLTVGSMSHDKVMHAIELYGTQVAPAVREELARREAATV
jgi:probable LLM family oxidoreductase